MLRAAFGLNRAKASKQAKVLEQFFENQELGDVISDHE